MAFELKPEFLKQLHTRKLLKVLRKTCVSQEQLDAWYLDVYGGFEDLAEKAGFTPVKSEYEKRANIPAEVFGFEDWVQSEVTLADLKAELATRPHVPNKIEAREIRKAKNKKNRGKGRRNR